MTTMSLRMRPALMAGSALLFWAVAACGVAWTHLRLERESAAACILISAAVIVAAAFVYMRLFGREATLEQAAAVGVSWAVMAMIAEFVTASGLAPATYPLLGSPSHDGLRSLLAIAWVAAPALFARRRS